MGHYLIVNGYGIQAKNNLQKAIIEKLKKFHRVRINFDQFDSILEEIKEIVEDTNKEFPRCKPEKPRSSTASRKDRYIAINEFSRYDFLYFEESAVDLNTSFMERINEAENAVISQLHYIAGEVYEPSRLCDLLKEIEEERLKVLFPGVFGEYDLDEMFSDEIALCSELNDRGFIGYVAEVLYPIQTNLEVSDDGVIKSSSYSYNQCYFEYVYGHTMEDLVKAIEAEGKEMVKLFIETEKKRLSNEKSKEVLS